MTKENDLITGINYVIDLLRHGYILDSRRAAHAIEILLKAEGSVTGKDELIRRVFGKYPSTLQEWKLSEFQLDWLEQQQPKLSRNGEDSLELLFEQAVAATDAARNANTLDEWLLRKKIAEGLLGITLFVGKAFKSCLSVAASSMLSQIEEVIVDSHVEAFWQSIAASDLDLYRANFELAQNSILFQLKVPDEWQKRMLQERLMLPRRLATELDSSGRAEKADLPREWRLVSWKLVTPYSFAHVSDERRRVGQFARASRFPSSEMLACKVVQEFFRTQKIHQRDLQMASIEYEYRGTRSSGDRLPQYDHSAIHKALIGAEVELSIGEVDSALAEEEKLRDLRQYELMVKALRGLQELYPWSSLVFHDLAIAHDESGQTRKALEYILPAVILNPMEPSEWKSLGIILQKLNNREEWQYVYGFRQYFERRREKLSPTR